MVQTFVTSFRVRYDECDAYGHLNNAVYLHYMLEAALQASDDVGYSFERHTQTGVAWLAKDTEIEYLNPVRYGDTVEVKTWVVDFRRIRSLRTYELSSMETGEMVARAQTEFIYIDVATQRPLRIPDDMIAAFNPAQTIFRRVNKQPLAGNPAAARSVPNAQAG